MRHNRFKNLNKLVIFILIALMMVQPFVFQGNLGISYADGMTADELAVTAIEKQYQAFKEGTPVDGAWGNLGSIDGYHLLKAGANLESWVYDGESFQQKLIDLVDGYIAQEAEETKANAKAIMEGYLVALELGENTKATELLDVIKGRQDGNGYFDQGDYSMYVNFPVYDMLAQSDNMSEISTATAINYLLANQDVTGAWPASNAAMYIMPDFMSTTQCLRALDGLEPLVGSRQVEVQEAIDKGKAWLKLKQGTDGGFRNGDDDKVANTVEVINTLLALEIPVDSWESETSNSATDFMMNGAYVDEAFGNLKSNTWALDGYLDLGAVVGEDMVVGMRLIVEDDSISERQVVSVTLQAIKVSGTAINVTNSAVTWTTTPANIIEIENGLVTGQSEGVGTLETNYNGYVDEIEFDVESIEDRYDYLALESVRKFDTAFKQGTSVNNTAGNINPIDGYRLEQIGINLENWVYEGETLKDKFLDNMDATVAQEQETTPASVVYIMQNYMLAKELNETERAENLLDIVVARQQGDGSFSGNPYNDLPTIEMLCKSGVIDQVNVEKTIDYILANQNGTSKAWADFASTAQTVRSLSYLESFAGDRLAQVQQAKNEGLQWLESKQVTNGGFTVTVDYGAYGIFTDDYLVDTAELVSSLNQLDIDIDSVMNNVSKTAIDYLINDAYVNNEFGDYKNLFDASMALEVCLILGATVDNDIVLDFSIDNSGINIYENATKQLKAEKTSGSSIVDITDQVIWTSENENVATVNVSGLVTGENNGQTNIAGTYNNKIIEVQINVLDRPEANYKYAYIAVIGKNGKLLYEPDRVKLQEGDAYEYTAMSALIHTGLSYEMQSSGYISSIEGQEASGMNGWMYTVDGESPLDVPKEITVSKNDKIIFWYSTDTNQDFPTWSDALDLVDVEVPDEAEQIESAKDLIEEYSDIMEDIETESQVLNRDEMMSEAEAEELRKELEDNDVDIKQVFDEEEMVLVDEKEEVVLFVPENALDEKTTIEVEELDADESPKKFAVTVQSSTYEFGPSGTKFDKPVTMSIKIPLTDDVDIDNLTPAWYDEDKGEWVEIPGVIDLENGIVIFEIDHFTKFAVLEKPARTSYADLATGYDWAKDEIEILAGQKIITGTGNGFEPSRNITRAEFVTLLTKALGLTIENQQSIFTDVANDSWYTPYVNKAFAEGLVRGDEGGLFRPSESLSRYEIATILQRIKNDLTDESNLPFFDKEMIPEWAMDGIEYAYGKDLIKGYPDNTYKGSQAITRAEAALVVYNYLEQIGK